MMTVVATTLFGGILLFYFSPTEEYYPKVVVQKHWG